VAGDTSLRERGGEILVSRPRTGEVRVRIASQTSIVVVGRMTEIPDLTEPHAEPHGVVHSDQDSAGSQRAHERRSGRSRQGQVGQR
jgi:hypothetical protein